MLDDVLACFQAAVAAVEPASLAAQGLSRRADLAVDGRLAVVSIGKAAAAMARGALEALPRAPDDGIVLVPRGTEADLRGFRVFAGGHPVPDGGGVAGARAVRRLAAELGRNDLLVCLISGGGSALMTLPPVAVPLADLSATTDLLLRAGADISELNSVRKHLDQLKGGRLARTAAPARVLGLVLSDVLGDRLDVIASGPLTPDPSTRDDAVAVLRRFGLWNTVPSAVRRHLDRDREESPKDGDPCFERVDVRVVGNNRAAAEAALVAARRRGYRCHLWTTQLAGEARDVGRELAELVHEVRDRGRPVPPPAFIVAAGETTVTVRGGGCGGRNQELVLGAATVLDGLDGVLIASLGTDGIDGPTDAAGAVATGDTLRRAAVLGLDPRRALSDNDAYPFFDALGDLVRTGPTGTNVMDLVMIVVQP